MEEKKNNKGLVWLIVILIILVLGLVGYIVYDKVLKNDKETINENITTTTTSITTTEKKDYHKKETKINDSGLSVTFEQKTSTDNCFILIGNKKIDLETPYCIDYDFELYDQFITVFIYSPNGGRLKDKLFVYNYQGEKLFTDEDMPLDGMDYINKYDTMSHGYNFNAENFKVDGTKIKYSILYNNDSCQLHLYEDNCGTAKISCSDLKDLGENINYTSTYEIELIDNKFSTPKLISSIKLKDTDVYKKAINSCE